MTGWIGCVRTHGWLLALATAAAVCSSDWRRDGDLGDCMGIARGMGGLVRSAPGGAGPKLAARAPISAALLPRGGCVAVSSVGGRRAVGRMVAPSPRAALCPS